MKTSTTFVVMTLVWIGWLPLVFAAADPAVKTAEEYYAAGFELSLNGKTERAVQSFRRALRLKPDWPEAHHYLAVLYYRLKDGVRAVHHLRQAERLYLKGNGPRSQKNLGIVRRNLEKAYADFALDPGDFTEMETLHPPAAGENWSRTGMGFIFGDQGYLLTLNHFVSGAGGLRVRFADNRTAPVARVRSFVVYDLALLRLGALDPGHEGGWELAGADAMRVGDAVHSLEIEAGNAGVRVRPIEGELTALKSIQEDANFFESDLPPRPELHGGPLLDSSGRIAGIRLSKERTVQAFQAAGRKPKGEVALKSSYIRKVLAGIAGLKLDSAQVPGKSSALRDGMEAAKNNLVFIETRP